MSQHSAAPRVHTADTDSSRQMVDLVIVFLNMVVQMDCRKISRSLGRHVSRPTLRCQDAICRITGCVFPPHIKVIRVGFKFVLIQMLITSSPAGITHQIDVSWEKQDGVSGYFCCM